ncbi:hypothetical protein LCGC14_0445200 [marine sediment metagenome]|uniref:Portal protein n=1 Tax=marine sediment metagenome TaxID=412755 RepID=A0A0F9VTG5_9ZZZZ
MPAEPFNAEELIRLVTSLEHEATFAEWHGDPGYLSNWRALRWRLQPVEIKGISEKLEYRSPAIASNVDRYRNRERAAKIRILVAAKDDEQNSVTAAQALENFAYALYEDFRRQGDADDRAIDYQVADGLGPRNITFTDDVLEKLFAKTQHIDDILERTREVFRKGFDGNPFKLRVPDPQVLYWDEDKSLVAEVGPVRVSTIRAAYEDGMDVDDIKDFTELVSDTQELSGGYDHQDRTVEFYHVETNDWVYEAIANDSHTQAVVVRRHPNPIGRPRYAFAAGHRTSGREPWKAYRPLVADLYSIVQLLNITRTLLMTGGLQTGRPMYQEVAVGAGADDFMTILSKPAETRNIVSIDTSKGDFLPPPRKGHRWEPIPIPDTSILEKADIRLEADLVNYGFPAILAPDAAIDATSGYDRSRQMEGAQDFLEPPLANNAAAWKELLLQCFDAIKELGVPVTIRTLLRAQGEDSRIQDVVTIRPEDIDDVHLEVRFESIPATVQFAMDEAARRDVEGGWMSRSRYMGTKYDDPEREAQQIDLDEMRLAGRQMAKDAVVSFIQVMIPQDMQQVAQELGVTLPVGGQGGNGQNPQRPAEGAAPGVGSPLVPPLQAQAGEVVPPGTPATGGASVGQA